MLLVVSDSGAPEYVGSCHVTAVFRSGRVPLEQESQVHPGAEKC